MSGCENHPDTPNEHQVLPQTSPSLTQIAGDEFVHVFHDFYFLFLIAVEWSDDGLLRSNPERDAACITDLPRLFDRRRSNSLRNNVPFLKATSEFVDAAKMHSKRCDEDEPSDGETYSRNRFDVRTCLPLQVNHGAKTGMPIKDWLIREPDVQQCEWVGTERRSVSKTKLLDGSPRRFAGRLDHTKLFLIERTKVEARRN